MKTNKSKLKVIQYSNNKLIFLLQFLAKSLLESRKLFPKVIDVIRSSREINLFDKENSKIVGKILDKKRIEDRKFLSDIFKLNEECVENNEPSPDVYEKWYDFLKNKNSRLFETLKQKRGMVDSRQLHTLRVSLIIVPINATVMTGALATIGPILPIYVYVLWFTFQVLLLILFFYYIVEMFIETFVLREDHHDIYKNINLNGDDSSDLKTLYKIAIDDLITEKMFYCNSIDLYDLLYKRVKVAMLFLVLYTIVVIFGTSGAVLYSVFIK